MRWLLFLWWSVGTSADCVDVWPSPKEMVDTCSGDTGLTSVYAAPYTDLFFYVNPPCCNPCASINESIRYHPAISRASHQPCYSVRGVDGVYGHGHVSINGTVAELLRETGYYLDPISNTIVPSTAEETGTETRSAYVPLAKHKPVVCDTLTQYLSSDNVCLARSPVDPAKEYVVGAGQYGADHEVHPKTNCSALGSYTVPSSSMDNDHTCVRYTTCDTGWSYERLAPTPTTDRVCAVLNTCTAGEYYVPPEHNATHLTRAPSCVGCPIGMYQLLRSHFETECRSRMVDCPGEYGYASVSVAEMDPTMATSAYCVTAALPRGYQYTGRSREGVPMFQKLSVSPGDDETTTAAPPPTPGASCPTGHYADVFGENEGDFICVACTKCSQYQERACGPNTDTVCGETPQVEALYVFGMAAYVCYIVGSLVVYWLHFGERHKVS